MSKIFWCVIVLLLTIPAKSEPLTMRQVMLFEKESIEEIIDKVVEFQMEEFGPKPARNWKVGTFFSGVMEAYKVTGNPKYLEISKNWCEGANWKVPNIYHADDVCKAQTFLEVYFQTGDKEVLAKIDANLKPMLERPTINSKKAHNRRFKGKEMEWSGRNLWWWCDALYMQPPVMVRLAKATGNKAYLDLMDEMFWDVHEFLYSPEHQLFFRDEYNMPDKLKTPKGQPVFWGRGNGWVIAGLVRTIDFIPEDDPRREKYITLFQEMMSLIVQYQQDDGLWRSSLNEPDWYDTPETSSSSFFTYALFAGINRGWLEPMSFLPSAIRAWEGLCGCLTVEGKLGFTQLVAARPSEVRAEDSIDYAHGAFLLAASELYKLNLTPEKVSKHTLKYQPITVAHDGAWTWFNDERVIFTDNYLLTGYLGDSDGRASVAVRGMKTNSRSWEAFYDAKLSTFSKEKGKPIDDHNNPALLQLDNGDVLAAYAQHHLEKRWYYRIGSRKKRFREWSEEKTFTTGEGPDRNGRATYNNLFQLMNEKGAYL